MKRRILALCLCLMLTVPGFAQPASQGYELEGLERYSSFSLNEETGEWTVTDPLFDALADAVAAGEVKNSMKDGVVLFQMRLSGNAQTGTIRPEMEIDYIASKPIGVQAVSILAGGVRYDLRAQGVSSAVGGYPAEQIVLPMADIDMAKAIAAAEEMTIVLHGVRDLCRVELSAAADAKNTKDELQQASLRCDGLLSALEELQIADYGLWDLSLQEWEAQLGFVPFCSAAEAEELEMLGWGDKGEAVEQLQRLLADAGFYAGAKEKEYDKKTAAAVARAQEYYGLLVTGSADGVLISCLRGESVPAAAQEDAPSPAMDALGDAGICIARWWQAQAVNASEAPAGSAGLVCADRDNVFVVAEGRIANNGSAELGLGWEVTAELVLNGSVRYACTLRAESDGGAAFTGSLLPLAQSRLIVVAELPDGALDAAETAEIVFSDGANTVAYSLKG